MKKMNVTIKESDLNGLHAYALATKTNTIAAKKFVGNKFKIINYVLSHSIITETETGEILEEMDCLVLNLEDGKTVGTNSTTMINKFKDIKEVCDKSGVSISEVELVIEQGESNNGTFNTIEIVL